MLHAVIALSSIVLPALALITPREVKYVYLHSTNNHLTFDQGGAKAPYRRPEFRFNHYDANGSDEQSVLVKDTTVAFSTDGGGTFTYAGAVVNGSVVPPDLPAGRSLKHDDASFTVRFPDQVAGAGNFYNGVCNIPCHLEGVLPGKDYTFFFQNHASYLWPCGHPGAEEQVRVVCGDPAVAEWPGSDCPDRDAWCGVSANIEGFQAGKTTLC